MPMEIQLKMVKIRVIVKYILNHKIMALVTFYFFIAVFLKLVSAIDILIPCLWKTLFHFNCPGCGLTTAFIKLLTLDISGAYAANPLIFIILPFSIYYICKDFIQFNEKLKSTLSQHAK